MRYVNSITFFMLAIGLVSCKNKGKQIDNVEITKQYFEVLDSSDYSRMSYWLADSLTAIEGAYKQSYSKSDYLEILKWDSVFDPEYQILEIEQKNEIVYAKISKMDDRISFLHKKPFISLYTITLLNEKIVSVETDYLNFDNVIWESNKNKLLNWIDKNHPELNGFIYDLSESGGLKFLKAIELYNNRE